MLVPLHTFYHTMKQAVEIYNAEEIEGRFWTKVEKTEYCWLWQGAKNPGGYGFMRPGSGVRKFVLAHRVSWVLHYGDIPIGFGVCHHCDNPSCVNPEHLFLGTQYDNIRDMYNKGRRKTWRRKLSEEDVINIRNANESTRTLAIKYGVHVTSINNIRSGRTWGWLK